MSPVPIAPPLDEREIFLTELRNKARSAMAEGRFADVVDICREVSAPDGGRAEFQIMMGIALYRSGRSGEGLETLRAAVDQNPNDPQLLANYGELLRQSGDLTGAVETLRRAEALDQKNPLIYFNLARACAQSGNPGEAENHYRAALAIDHTFLPAHRALGNLLKGSAAAQEAGLDDVSLRLAALLAQGKDSRDYDFALRTALQDARRVIGFGAGAYAALLVLGKLLLDLEEAELAIEVLEKGRQLPGAHRDYDIALSMAYAFDRQWRNAHEAAARLVRFTPMATRQCIGPEIDVLVLEAMYNPAIERRTGHRGIRLRYGDTVYSRFGTIAEMGPRRMSFHHLFIDNIDPADPRIDGRFNVIYNNVTAAEINLRRNYTPIIEGIAGATGLEVINRPDRIDRATRSGNYEMLKDVAHLVFPKTLLLEIDYRNLDETAEAIAGEFEFPILLRSTFHNTGKSLYRADNLGELRAALRKFDRFRKEPIYAIQYHESKHHSGSHLRYRVMFIDGVLYGGRMYLGDSWLVGNSSARRSGDGSLAKLREEERHWMSYPDRALGAENIEALGQVNDILGLDILGMEVGVTGDGTAVIFEANPNMNFLTVNRRTEEAPYYGAAGERIASAVEDLLLKRSKFPILVH